MKYEIELVNVSKAFNGNSILEGVNFKIEKGTVTGIIGKNGVGKSVIFKHISGLLKADEGQVFVRGEEVGKDFDFPPRTGILIDEPGYVDIYDGYTNLKYLADIQNTIGESQIREAMSLVGLDSYLKTKVKNYSLGMKKKLGIAQAIMENQDILILDEPFNALDDDSYDDLKLLIQEFKSQGKTVLLTSHMNADLDDICDNIYRLERRKLKLVEKDS